MKRFLARTLVIPVLLAPGLLAWSQVPADSRSTDPPPPFRPGSTKPAPAKGQRPGRFANQANVNADPFQSQDEGRSQLRIATPVAAEEPLPSSGRPGNASPSPGWAMRAPADGDATTAQPTDRYRRPVATQPPGRFTPDPYSQPATGVSDQPAAGPSASDGTGEPAFSGANPGSADAARAQPAAGGLFGQPPVAQPYAAAQPDAASAQTAEVSGALAPDTAGRSGAGKPGAKHLEGRQTPMLEIEKIAPAEVQVGKPATFEIIVRNTGSVVAHDVEVIDDIPQGAQLVSSSPRAQRGPREELIWSLGTLGPNEKAAVQLELLPTTEGELGSVARVRFATETSARTVATRPELVLTVTAPREVMIGERLHLKIRISNPGTGVATGVVISEQTPPNLEHSAGPQLEYDIGDLRPKESRELDLELKAVKAGPVLNVLSARGDGQLQADQRTPLTVVAPALDLTMDGPRRRYLERQAVYTLWVSNPGTASAEDVELIASLPPGMEFVAANNSGQYDPKSRTVQWLLEELPANQKGSVTLTMLPVEAGEQRLRVAGTAKNGLAAEKQESVLIEGVAAILFQVADLADPVEVGGETTYEIRVGNRGSKAASNVQIVALLPPEAKPVGAEGPTRFEFTGQQVRFLPLPRLNPKAETIYRVKVQCTAVGDLRMRALLTTDDIQTPITKEEATRVYADR